MNLRQIEYFVHVAESGSFSRASAIMGTTQPAISRQVRALERELDRHLFHRNGRGVLLTDDGTRFLAYAKGILHQLDGARHAVTGSEADLVGKVVVGLPPSVGHVMTVPLVRAFRERYPRAELSVMEALSVTLQERMLAGRVDVAVIHNPVPSMLIEVEPLLSESLCLLTAARSNRTRPVAFSDLPRFDLIFPGAPHPLRSLVDAEAARRGVKLKVSLEIDAIPVIMQLVAEGYGHAVVPYNVVRTGMSGAGVVARPIVSPRLGSMVALVTPTRRPPTLLASGVTDLVRQMLHATLATKKPPRKA